MKRLLFAGVCIVACLIAGCATQDIEPTVRDSSLAFSIPDLDGNIVSNFDERFGGKVVLIDVFGTWCPPCRESIPFLEELHHEYADEGLVIVGVAFEVEENAATRREALTKFIDENAIAYTVLDGGTTADRALVLPDLESFQGYPTMVIIGRDGKVAHANTVFVPRELPLIRSEVENAL